MNEDRKHQLTNYSHVPYQQDLHNAFHDYHLQLEEDSLGQHRFNEYGVNANKDELGF